METDSVYIQEGEAAIYRDGKIHAIEKISKLDEAFFKTLKLIFPNSDIHTLTNETTETQEVPKEHIEEEGL